MTQGLRRDKTRPAHLLTGHTGTKLAQHRPFIGTSGTKLAQHTKKRQFWALFRLQGEYSHARGSTKQSRAKIVTHRARKHERLERKIAPARGAKGRRETFFAHARSQEPFLAHFNRARAIFLSLRMHAKHWSNPLGRYFFRSSPVEWCNRFVSFGLGYALSWSGVSSCWVGCGVSRDLVRMSRLR